MSKSVRKCTEILVNFFMIVFPLIFAMNIYICINKEADVFYRYSKELHEPKVEEKIELTENVLESAQTTTMGTENCSNSVIINMSFAVILAALWNAKKIIKLGII